MLLLEGTRIPSIPVRPFLPPPHSCLGCCLFTSIAPPARSRPGVRAEGVFVCVRKEDDGVENLAAFVLKLWPKQRGEPPHPSCPDWQQRWESPHPFHPTPIAAFCTLGWLHQTYYLGLGPLHMLSAFYVCRPDSDEKVDPTKTALLESIPSQFTFIHSCQPLGFSSTAEEAIAQWKRLRDGGDITQIPAFDFSQKPIGNCKPLGFCCVQLNGSNCLCFGQPHGVWQYSELGAECCEAECRRLFVWPIPIISQRWEGEPPSTRPMVCFVFAGPLPFFPTLSPVFMASPHYRPSGANKIFVLPHRMGQFTNKHKTVRH